MSAEKPACPPFTLETEHLFVYFKNNFVCVFYMYTCAHHSIHVEVKGQLKGTGSFLPPCRFWEPN